MTRYNAEFVATSDAEIVLDGWVGGPPPPLGESLVAKLRQIWWALRLARSIPHAEPIMASQPHLGLGCAMSGRPFTQFVHGGEWEDYPFGRILLKELLRRAKAVVFNSVATKERLFPQRTSDHFFVVKPGLSSITPVLEEDSSELVLARGTPATLKILSVARLSPRKGHKKLIRAVQECHQSGFDVNLKLVGSGYLEGEIRQLCSGQPNIVIETDLPDSAMKETYDDADIFVLCPETLEGGEGWEGFGIVFLEAAARGLPIIASTSGGISEATCANGAVLLPPNCDASDIAQSIRTLARDLPLRTSMSEANLGWALANKWTARAKEIHALLRFIAGAPAA